MEDVKVEKKKDLMILFQDHNVTHPKMWKYMYYVSEIFSILAALLFLFGPLVVKYSNAFWLGKAENYSLVKLLVSEEISEFAFLGVALAIISLTMCPMFLYHGGLLWSVPYFNARRLTDQSSSQNKSELQVKGADGKVRVLKNLPTRSLVAVAIGVLDAIINIILLLFVPDMVDRFTSAGWGCTVCIIFIILELFFSAIPPATFLFYKIGYENGKIPDEVIIKAFKTPDGVQTKSVKNLFKQDKSISEQLTELNQLKEQGLISEEDYEIKKKQILGL